MKDNKFYYLIRTIIMFVFYMFYASILSKIFSLFGLDNHVITMFIGDLIFFITIIFVYKNSLKKKIENFKNEYSSKNKIWIIIKWTLILLIANILIGLITKLFCSNITCNVDDNSMALIQLFDTSFIYSLFKILIFAPIAEELIFKESIRDVVKNNLAFVLISSSIYTVMNFMYASTDILFLELFKYFIFSLILSLAYIKNNDNIIIVMIIKFFYNLLPTLMLIISMIAGINI